MDTIVKDLASKNLITVQLGTKVQRALAIMETRSVRHLPVVDDRGEILGLLSQRDIYNLQNPDKILVESFMSSPVKSVPEDMPLRTAILKMLELKISCFLVADKNSVATGIITTDDILWYLAEILKNGDLVRLPTAKTINLQRIGEIAHELSMVGI